MRAGVHRCVQHLTECADRGRPARDYVWLTGFLGAWFVLFLGVWIGFAFAEWVAAFPDEGPPVPVVDHDERVDTRSGWDLFSFILRRNLSVYLLLLLGLASAGLVTFVVLLGNGIAVGQVIGLAKSSGISNGMLADLLITHGVLELGAFCIAGAVGFQGFLLAIGRTNFDREALRTLRPGLVLGFGVVALAVAAAIEAFVTASLAESGHGT